MKRKQKKQIEQRLEAEAASESRGYVRRPRKAGGVTKKALKDSPRRWSAPRGDVEARPLASLGELLDTAKSEVRGSISIMNERIERRLEAESTSESPGFVGGGRGGRGASGNGNGVPSLNATKLTAKNGPARWAAPRADVEVGPLASLAELLDAAEEGPPT